MPQSVPSTSVNMVPAMGQPLALLPPTTLSSTLMVAPVMASSCCTQEEGAVGRVASGGARGGGWRRRPAVAGRAARARVGGLQVVGGAPAAADATATSSWRAAHGVPLPRLHSGAGCNPPHASPTYREQDELRRLLGGQAARGGGGCAQGREGAGGGREQWVTAPPRFGRRASVPGTPSGASWTGGALVGQAPAVDAAFAPANAPALAHLQPPGRTAARQQASW